MPNDLTLDMLNRHIFNLTSGLADPVLPENSERRFQVVTCDGPQDPIKSYDFSIINQFIVQREPVLQLDPAFPYCTQAFRDKLNAKLLTLFGTQEVVLAIEDRLLISATMEVQVKEIHDKLMRDFCEI